MNFDHIWWYTGKEFARIRDEGDKVTCTFKSLQNDILQIDCVSEIEVEVSNFDKMIAIWKGLGMQYRSYQETKREKRILETVQWTIDFCIDILPWVSEFLEIEWPNQQIVEYIAVQLWLRYVMVCLDLLIASMKKLRYVVVMK
jgi:predicted adenylyl cyclase CyaB